MPLPQLPHEDAERWRLGLKKRLAGAGIGTPAKKKRRRKKKKESE